MSDTTTTRDAGPSASDLVQAAQQGALPPGTLIDRKYRVIRLLGQGTQGTVYEVEHTGSRRRLALKLVKPEMEAQRLLQEAQLATQADHPNIVSAVDVGEHKDGSGTAQLYLVTALLRGKSLREVLRGLGPLTLDEAGAVLGPIAAALVRAHEQGIVHRDLKPENIFLDETQVGTLPKLIDFGISKRLDGGGLFSTQTGVVVGTPIYMAPEHIGGGSAGPASDVYALGVVLFECLVGRTPFGAAELTQLVMQIAAGVGRGQLRELRPELPAELFAVVDRAMEPLLRDRYGSVRELLAALLEVPGLEGLRGRSWARLALDGPELLHGVVSKLGDSAVTLRQAPAGSAEPKVVVELDQVPRGATPVPPKSTLLGMGVRPPLELITAAPGDPSPDIHATVQLGPSRGSRPSVADATPAKGSSLRRLAVGGAALVMVAGVIVYLAGGGARGVPHDGPAPRAPAPAAAATAAAPEAAAPVVAAAATDLARDAGVAPAAAADVVAAADSVSAAERALLVDPPPAPAARNVRRTPGVRSTSRGPRVAIPAAPSVKAGATPAPARSAGRNLPIPDDD